MHELSIAEQILPPLLKQAEAHGAETIKSAHLQLGEMMMIVPHALEQALVALSRGTIAEGAEWKFSEVPTRMRCNQCSNEFQPDMGNYVCPECGHADAVIIQGQDIVIESIDCEIRSESDENTGS